MERGSTPAGQEGGHGILPDLLEALAGLDAEATKAIAEIIALHRDFPAWAVWLPSAGHAWVAVRPASARAPGPDLPVVWAQAPTAAGLADRMRRADGQLSPS